MQTVRVPLAAIAVSVLNTRKDLAAGGEDASLDDLARSIAEQGLISPPVLRRQPDGRYEVVAGQRRVLACRALGLEAIPAIVRDDLSDDDALALSLVENVQRADMSPLDKARAFQALRDQQGSLAGVSRATGVVEATVRRYLALLDLPDALQHQVTTGAGPAGIGVMAQLATSFAEGEDMEAAWTQVQVFNSGVARTILRRSGGDLGQLQRCVDQAIEGAFDRKMCGASLESCPYLPPELRGAVHALLRRAAAGECSV